MGKRYWIGLVLVLLILLGAFCVPWLLLRMEQRWAEKQVLTVTEEAQLNAVQLSLVDKQIMLAKDEILILEDAEPDQGECDRLIDSARKEMENLWRSGAIDEHSYLTLEMMSMQVRQCVAFSRADATVFRYYSLNDAEGLVRLYLDYDTEKILRIAFLEAWAQGEEMARDIEKAVDASEMQAWAQYYGLKLEGVGQRLDDTGEFRQEALLTGEDGQRFVFCKIYNYENGDLDWRSVEETTLDFTDSIQEGAEEDANVG